MIYIYIYNSNIIYAHERVVLLRQCKRLRVRAHTYKRACDCASVFDNVI